MSPGRSALGDVPAEPPHGWEVIRGQRAGLAEISWAFLGRVTREKLKPLNQGNERKTPREEISIGCFRHHLDADSSLGTIVAISPPHGAALCACLLPGAWPGTAGGFLGRRETPCTGQPGLWARGGNASISGPPHAQGIKGRQAHRERSRCPCALNIRYNHTCRIFITLLIGLINHSVITAH